MSALKAVLWTGGNAPNREATLKVQAPYFGNEYQAFWEPGYCGCEDCHCIVGRGRTAEAAEADHWQQWEEEYGVQ